MRRPRRIAYLSPASCLFGAERSLLDTMSSLDQTRFVPHLVTLEAGPLENVARSKGVVVTRLPWLQQPHGPWSLHRVGAMWRFAQWLRASQIEVVILNLFSAWMPLDLGLLVMASKLARAKFILRHRTSTCWWLSLYDKFWLARVDGIFSVTQAAIVPWLQPRRSDLWFRIKPECIRTIPSSRAVEELGCTSAERVRIRMLGIPDDARVVGIVARIDPIKRQHLFLEAAAMIHQVDPLVWFVIVGDLCGEDVMECKAYQQSLKRFVAENGLVPWVIFTGYRDDVPQLLRNFDVCVLPSRQEALGGVLIEAMALGVPVVASRVDGIPEIVKDGEAGLLIPSDDPNDYAAAILRLLNDRALARRMGDFGKRWATQFDSTRVTRLLEQCYEEVIVPNAFRQRPHASTEEVAHA